MNAIQEIQISPIKPNNGLVAFASIVIDKHLYHGSIGIVTRPNGGYRLVYPTKKVGNSNINLFYPINKEFASYLEAAILKVYEDVMSKSNVRHSGTGIG